jgi:para-nitrobenzyl esterase
VANETLAQTQTGRIRGVFKHGVHAFKGIPYGAPTQGSARFKPSRPPQAWSGVRDALDYGPVCPQELTIMVGPETAQSEDCLRLNVWTPELAHGRRPVMVWLHGGGFRIGSGERLTRGALARKQDVVVVTLNHRINVFGMLYLAELCGAEYADSGNVILHDVLLALSWVRDNIAAFGGDPNNVTLFGESGGGRKVSTLMAAASAAGLFHRAIVQSGSQLRVCSNAAASAFAERVLGELALAPAQAHALHELPAARLLSAYHKAAASGPDALPVVDGRLLTRHPFDPDAPALSAQVPMIIGTNRDENAFFLSAAEWKTDAAGLRERVARALSAERADEVIETFRALYPEASHGMLLAKILTARGYFLDSTLQAERKAALGAAPAYLYQFDFVSPQRQGRLGAHHALEVPFVFDELEASLALVGPADAETQALADRMSSSWAQFARSGDPNHPSLPRWQPYTAARRDTMVFDRLTQLSVDPRQRERELMASFGPQQPRALF